MDPQCDARPSEQRGPLTRSDKGSMWAKEGGKEGGKDLAHRTLKYGGALRPATLTNSPLRLSDNVLESLLQASQVQYSV